MKLIRALIIILIGGGLLYYVYGEMEKPIPVDPAASNISEARALFDAAMVEGDVPGLSVAVANASGIVWEAGFGWADIENQIPMGTGIRQRTGSISKILTTAALARLIEEDRIDLDAPIQTYVPGFPEKTWPITVRQLAAHIAGIRHYKDDEFVITEHFDSVSEGLSIFSNDPLEFEPGTQYSYSSYGWNLISAAIEGASGQNFLAFMQSVVFAPLDLANIEPEDVRFPVARMATPYLSQDGEITIAPFVDNSYKWAGGGFISTSGDLARFAMAHAGPGYLSDETLNLLFANQYLADGTEVSRGIGWQSGWHQYERRYCGEEAEPEDARYCAILVATPNAVMHSGGAMGGSTMLILDRDRGLAAVVLKNDSGSSASAFLLALETLAIFQD